MDAYAKLDQIVAVIESARAMPMSVSCIVNRNEVLDLLDDLRELLPTEIQQARFVLDDRAEVVEEGRREAARLLAEAKRERARLVAETEVAAAAGREADSVRHRTHDEAQQVRDDVDDYVDARLAHFEVVLHKTLAAVERGRRQLARDAAGDVPHPELADLDGPDYPEPAAHSAPASPLDPTSPVPLLSPNGVASRRRARTH